MDEMNDAHTRILVIFANPIDTSRLQLGAEDRTIKEALYRGKYSDRIGVETCHAANLHDVRLALLRNHYCIVQFSGHSDSSGVVFEDRDGQEQKVSFEVFASFMRAHSPPIECIILNACSTLERSKFLSFDIPFVIAMRAPIGDASAIEFSRGFYDAIASGKSIEFAFNEGLRCVRAVARSDRDLPVLVKRETLSKYPLQPQGIRSEEYDCWYQQLSSGKLEIVLHPSASIDINILVKILNQVLQEKQFSQSVVGRAEVVLWELMANVASHVNNSEAVVGLEINTRYLPLVMISVADHGKGYDLYGIVRQQAWLMKSGKPERGIGRICRLSDNVLPSHPSDSNPFFTIYCTLYDVPWPGSICDDYSWCEKVILDYSNPISVWFGNIRYSLRWRYEGFWPAGWAAFDALDFALDNDIQPIFDVYLGHLAVSNLPFLFYEIRGSGPTEAGRTSAEIITETLETYLTEYFTRKRVLIYASQDAYTGRLKTLTAKYGLDLYISGKACRQKLEALDKEHHRQE
jgi:anti-sigma regulatory factor (Ser/Thr protein kinase)